MNISFERTYNSTVLIDQDGILFGLPPTMYVIPSRWYGSEMSDDNQIEISNGTNFTYKFDWRDVTYPVASDRNELITILISDFFFKLGEGGGGGGGTGDVTGPSSSTDNALVRFNGTTGKIIQSSSVIVDDKGRFNVYTATANPNTTTTLDSFLTTLTTAVKWTIVCENGTSDLLMQEILVWNDNLLPIFSEYGILDKGTGIDDLLVSVDLNVGYLRLRIQNLSLTKTYSVRTSRYLL